MASQSPYSRIFQSRFLIIAIKMKCFLFKKQNKKHIRFNSEITIELIVNPCESESDLFFVRRSDHMIGCVSDPLTRRRGYTGAAPKLNGISNVPEY